MIVTFKDQKGEGKTEFKQNIVNRDNSKQN
ncbi:hypothetical protein SAMN04489864_102408 [Pedobacter insulae]|uniref:Uncharacterized protein n=1 Tax=Pedobacter insulae TaxID=414048 RepID=A0A1I2UYN9_9SPHI|nr:hypothetical protein SAMN04489864_102408 [Pedobacter insulae]